MKYPLDKWSRDYGTLLEQQVQDLKFWESRLRPEVYADLAEACRRLNQPVTPEVMEIRQSLRPYKAGGIHVCPVGFEIPLILMDPQKFQEDVEYILRSNESVVAQAKEDAFKQSVNHNQTVMKNIAKKFVAIAALLTEIADLMENVSVGADAPEAEDGITLKSLTALAGRKDPKLAGKVLAKFGAEYEDGKIADLDEKDFEKAHAKLEALDDAEGAGEPEDKKGGKGKEGKVDLELLRKIAEGLITDGKSSQIKKILTKHGSESLTKLDEDQYEAVHAKFIALQD